jgi:tetratricopeptide (TPR) repeat protein
MNTTSTAQRLDTASKLLQIGRWDRAEPLLRQVLDDEPGNLQATLSLVKICSRRNLNAEAVDLLDAMRSSNPDNPEAQRQAASLLAKFNCFGPARTAWRRLLELEPDLSDAWLKLALITNFREEADDLSKMETAFARPGLPDTQRRPLAYALGKAYDDIADYDRAFEHFLEGNRIARHTNRYTLDQQIGEYLKIRDAFDSDFFARHAGAGIDDASAIFVTGLGRSGTTLVERILAAHQLVYGGGELTYFDESVKSIGNASQARFPFGGRTLPTRVLQHGAAEYVRHTQALSENARFITNKSVGTIIFVGMIAIMMPHAKIVVVNRDPRDQALSFFQKDFGNVVPCYYDLAELGRAYYMYQRLLEYWQTLLPQAIYAVRYEDVVGAPDAQVASMLEYCGLEFDPGCLRFFESGDAINTMSLEQVRKPIHSKSVGRWKNYRKHLQPLLDSLERHRELDLADL